MTPYKDTWEYEDEETGIKVFINYTILDESFDHHFGTEYQLGIESDLDRVEDEDGKEIPVDSAEVEDIIDKAFDAFDNVPISDLIHFDYDPDDGPVPQHVKNSVGWQYLNNNNISWS